MAPVLLTEADSERAVALDSVSWLRDPLSVMSPNNYFAQDGHTRTMLFAMNLDLAAGEDYSAISCTAEDAEHRIYFLPVEYIGRVPEVDWLRQVVVRLPDELAGRGDVWVTIRIHNLDSNRAIVKIR
jgi:hypothetical protein